MKLLKVLGIDFLVKGNTFASIYYKINIFI